MRYEKNRKLIRGVGGLNNYCSFDRFSDDFSALGGSARIAEIIRKKSIGNDVDVQRQHVISIKNRSDEFDLEKEKHEFEQRVLAEENDSN